MSFSKTIKVLSIEIKNPPDPSKKYTILTVNYTDNGKLNSRNILSFVAKDLYAAFSKAVSGESFEITEEKNAKGYYEFTSAKSVGVLSGTATEATGGTAPRQASSSSGSTYSNKEERDQTQIYIVKQSTLKAAIDTLPLLNLKKVGVQDVLSLAKQYEDYVFGRASSTVPSVVTSTQAAQRANEELVDVE